MGSRIISTKTPVVRTTTSVSTCRRQWSKGHAWGGRGHTYTQEGPLRPISWHRLRRKLQELV